MNKWNLVLKNNLNEILAWKANLDEPQHKRRRKDCNDKTTIQTLQYWLRSYQNTLSLHKEMGGRLNELIELIELCEKEGG
jgi:hypothetical protein